MTPAQQGAVFAAARSLLGLSQPALAELVSAVPRDIRRLEAGEGPISLKERISTLFEQFGFSIRYDDDGATLRISSDAQLSAELALALHREVAQEATRVSVQESRSADRAALLAEFDEFRLRHRSARQAIIHFVRMLSRRKGGLKPARRTLETWLALREREGERGLRPRWAGGRQSLLKSQEPLRLELVRLAHGSPRPTIVAMVAELKRLFPEHAHGINAHMVGRAIRAGVATIPAVSDDPAPNGCPISSENRAAAPSSDKDCRAEGVCSGTGAALTDG